MAITAAMVKELRELTGAGMMDCKKALNETNGDMDAAVDFLRKNGQAKAEKKAGRIAAEDPDILILDIEMPEKSGIEIKNELTEGDRPLIIFATAYFEFMKDAFGRNVIGYMEKPVKKYEFNNYMKAAVNILSLETVIHIDSETEVKSKDVLLIGTDNGYTEIEMITGRKITGIRKSMKAWEEELQQYGFMRISEGCIINCRYVKGFEGDNVVIKDIGVKLRVSRRKKADCVKFYRAYRAKSSKYI